MILKAWNKVVYPLEYLRENKPLMPNYSHLYGLTRDELRYNLDS